MYKSWIYCSCFQLNSKFLPLGTVLMNYYWCCPLLKRLRNTNLASEMWTTVMPFKHMHQFYLVYYIPCKNNIGANHLTAQYNNLSYSKFCRSSNNVGLVKFFNGWFSSTQHKLHGCKTFSKDAWNYIKNLSSSYFTEWSWFRIRVLFNHFVV